MLYIWLIQVNGVNQDIVWRCELLCVLISDVAFPWPTVYLEVSLFYEFLEPIESYIYWLGTFLVHCFVVKYHNRGVVKLYWVWGRRVVHINEIYLDGYSLLCIDIGGSSFCLGCWTHDIFQYSWNDVCGSILFEFCRVGGVDLMEEVPYNRLSALGVDIYEPLMWMWSIIPVLWYLIFEFWCVAVLLLF